jgi:hypothetical protein
MTDVGFLGRDLMIKKLLLALAAMTLAGAVSAAPVIWTFGGGSTLTGSFTFNANSVTFSSVTFNETFFVDNYTSATGTALSLFATSVNYGDQTSLSFLAPLTNLGGLISFTGVTQCFSACNTPNPHSFTGTVSAPIAVPVPATLGLLLLGLAVLAGSRREKA